MEKKYVVVVNVDGKELCFVRAVKKNGKRYADFSPLHAKAKCFNSELAANLRCAWLDLFGIEAKVDTFYRVILGK